MEYVEQLLIDLNKIEDLVTIDKHDGMKNPPAAPNTACTFRSSSMNMMGDDFDMGRFPGFFSSLVKL